MIYPVLYITINLYTLNLFSITLQSCSRPKVTLEHETGCKYKPELIILVTLVAGGKTSENCTYFESSTPSPEAGEYAVSICKNSPDICQVIFYIKEYGLIGKSF